MGYIWGWGGSVLQVKSVAPASGSCLLAGLSSAHLFGWVPFQFCCVFCAPGRFFNLPMTLAHTGLSFSPVRLCLLSVGVSASTVAGTYLLHYPFTLRIMPSHHISSDVNFYVEGHVCAYVINPDIDEV